MSKKKRVNKRPAPENETKAERFVRVVRPRVNKAVKAISVIGYCAGTAYESTPEQVSQIVETLRKAVDVTSSKFTTKPKETSVFNFTE